MVKPTALGKRVYGKITNLTVARCIVHQKVKFFDLINLDFFNFGSKPFLKGITHKLQFDDEQFGESGVFGFVERGKDTIFELLPSFFAMVPIR